MRISALAAALGLAVAIPAGPVAAQDFPVKPIRIVVPFAAGGGNDTLARAMAQKMTEAWGQSVLVENRPGGSSKIGAQYVARSAPDGYTLLFTANPHTVNPALYDDLPYDTRKDFAPVTQVASAPLMLVVHPSVPARTVAELIALAKAKPGALNYGSSGIGGPQHMAGELMKHQAGIDIVHVPFKGTGDALKELLSGRIGIMYSSPINVANQIRAGGLRALGVTARQRLASFPDVPTIAEAGNLPDYEVTTWYGMLAPAGTPPDVIAKLQGGIAAAMRSPEIAKRLENDGTSVVASTPQEFAAFIDAEIDRYTRLVKAAGIKAE